MLERVNDTFYLPLDLIEINGLKGYVTVVKLYQV